MDKVDEVFFVKYLHMLMLFWPLTSPTWTRLPMIQQVYSYYRDRIGEYQDGCQLFSRVNVLSMTLMEGATNWLPKIYQVYSYYRYMLEGARMAAKD